MQNLVIVESPAKARTISRFLGKNFRVEASMGHIRDLPKSEIGIDTEHNFIPKYIIPRDKLKKVNELKKLAKASDNLFLATDPDREGEAIAWHLAHLLTMDNRKSKIGVEDRRSKAEKEIIDPQSSTIHHLSSIQRVVFHEITESAIKESFKNPREIDLNLVDAQQARRILDRLVGYKLSPLLWQKVKSGLSAGRVQSVAVRLVVEREEEVKAFKPVEYWSIEAELTPSRHPGGSLRPIGSRDAIASLQHDDKKIQNDRNKFIAALIAINGKKAEVKTEKESKKIVDDLEKAEYVVKSVLKKEVRKYAAPPFTTSTLQQTASNQLGMTAKKTMMIAQNLYEHGMITYMRTDSVNLSAQAVDSAREYIKKYLGKTYVPVSPKVYKTKSKVAQEAHEAIRPTNIEMQSSELKMQDGFTRDHIRLYDLIWKRMMASQMADAVMDQTTIDVNATTANRLPSTSEVGSEQSLRSGDLRKSGSYTLRATGSIIKFDGWLKLYQVASSKYHGEEADEQEKEEQRLPELTEAEKLKLIQLLPKQHFTEPPPRYNEASLIKKLEELGIGRPSTYAPTLSTIQDRYYVERRERKFFPTELGIAVTKFLMQHFSDVFDYAFTAQMEDNLDNIANGEKKWQPTIGDFYVPFEKKLMSVGASAERVKIEAGETDKICPDCKKPLIIKFGRFGKFLACSGFPDCKHTEGIEENINVKCPECGKDVVMRKTRKGRPFYGCKGWPDCKYASWTKPKGASVENKQSLRSNNLKEL